MINNQVLEVIENVLSTVLKADKRILAFECLDEVEDISKAWKNLAKIDPSRVRSLNGYVNGVVGAAIGTAVAGLKPIVMFSKPVHFVACYQFLISILPSLPRLTNNELDASLTILIPNQAAYEPQQNLPIIELAALIPNLLIFSPASADDLRVILQNIVNEERPSLILLPSLNLSQELAAEGISDDMVETTDFSTTQSLVCEGQDITLFTWGEYVFLAKLIANELSNNGIKAEIINSKTILPFEFELLQTSLKKTHRLALIDDKTEVIKDFYNTEFQKKLFTELLHPMMCFSFREINQNYIAKLREHSLLFSKRCVVEIRKSFERG